MTSIAATADSRRRLWAASLALCGMLFVATAAVPLPVWMGDLGRVCSANGAADQPEAAGHDETCVILCAVAGLAGPPPQAVMLVSRSGVAPACLPGGGIHWTGRIGHPVQARAPPSV